MILLLIVQYYTLACANFWKIAWILSINVSAQQLFHYIWGKKGNATPQKITQSSQFTLPDIH